MDRVLIAWNIPNWITILLMVAAGYLLVGLVYQVIGQGDNANVSTWFKGMSAQVIPTGA